VKSQLSHGLYPPLNKDIAFKVKSEPHYSRVLLLKKSVYHNLYIKVLNAE